VNGVGRVVFVGNRYIGMLMEAIGAEAIPVFDVIDAEKQVRTLVSDDDVDVLVLTEDIYIELISRHIKFKKEGTNRPILVVLPNLEGSVGKRVEDLYNLVSQAVGVKLQLKG